MMSRISGVLLVLFLSCQLAAQAKVAPSIITQEEPSSVDCRSKRTLFNIVWGCLSTTIVCAWAAIHPNIPPREGPFKGALRRLDLMFWTIVAPEILPCWALNQLLAARKVRDVYNDGKGYKKKKCGIFETVKKWFSLYEIKEAASPAWTLAHGHFLIMGGIHIVDLPDDGSTQPTEENTAIMQRAGSDVYTLVEETYTDMEKEPSEKELEPELEQDRVTILTLEMLEELVKDPEFKIQITAEEISHRSKGDALSKMILILQSTWFILQCLGRSFQGLNLTRLELTTLAMASLNAITFGLWWDKPLGAQSIVRVYLKRRLTDSERPEVENRSARSGLISVLQRLFERCGTRIRDAFLCQTEGNIFVSILLLPFAILVLLLSPIITFAIISFAGLADLVMGHSTSFPPDDTHVPTFYVPRHRHSLWCPMLFLITLGAIFGVIHCFAWNSPFPSYAQQRLWRVASLAVTTIPIATYPFVVSISKLVGHISGSSTWGEISDTSSAFLCTLAYVVARVVLLVLAFAQLKDLPPTAFVAIDWIKLYPHFL